MPERTTEISLHLFEVLEEEYVSLHKPIPVGEILYVGLSDAGGAPRQVEAARDWAFREGHVKSHAALAADLLLAGEEKAAREGAGKAAAGKGAGTKALESRVADDAQQAVRGQRDDWHKNQLREYLFGKISEETLLGLAGRDAAPADAGARDALEAALNALLKDTGLYDRDHFSETWMGAASRGLAVMHYDGVRFEPSPAAAGDGAPERYDGDLEHFNRLLLEDAFPDYIEPISNIRLAAIYQRFHEAQASALSLSGGGIRSGTFALGLLQGMARHRILSRFDYLSTVSGGGYIGSWLTAWLHRHPEGVRGVTRELANVNPSSKIDPDPAPLRYLREYSNFITPKVGLLTADTWAFAGIYLRNLLLNWMVFIPLLIAALMLPRLMLAVTLVQPVKETPQQVALTTPHPGVNLDDLRPDQWKQYEAESVRGLLGLREAGAQAGAPDNALYPRHLLLILGLLLGVWALGYVGFNRPGLRGELQKSSRFWRTRADQRGFLLYCLLPLLTSAVVLTTYWAWSQETTTYTKNILLFIVFGLLFIFAGGLTSMAVLRRRLSNVTWQERLALLLTGVVGGLLFWLLSLHVGDPVMAYGLSVRDGEVIGRPLLWADWTSWSWYDWKTELYVSLAVPIFLLIFWASTAFYVGLSSYITTIKDEDREWWARFGAWLIIAAIVWFAANVVVIFGPLALLHFPKFVATVGGISGLIAVIAGRSTLTAARDKPAEEEGKSKGKAAAAGLLGSALPLLGALFLAAFMAAVSLLTTGIIRGLALWAPEISKAIFRDDGAARADVGTLTNIPDDPLAGGFERYAAYIEPRVPHLRRPSPPPDPEATPAPSPCTPPSCNAAVGGEADGEEEERVDEYTGAKVVHMNVLHHTSLMFLLALAALSFMAGLCLSRFINLNIFSLHGGYRIRLIRAFLGASRPSGERKSNPFTGFDSADNIHMHELRWALLDEGDILKPTELAEALRNVGEKDEELTKYLRERELLKNVQKLTNTAHTPGLLAALRKDLNGALEKERLYEQPFAGKYFGTARAQEMLEHLGEATGEKLEVASLARVSLRSDYHILLNRLMLEGAYSGMIKTGPPPPYKLMHVVNTSLNLVGGDKLAWQQRKAEPFSVSPLHSGCFRVGYRRSIDYGGPDGISIGTAAAVSGAAVSSNMGYYNSSPVIALLLTLFNVRLGWWLGNPGPAGRETYKREKPILSVTPVIYEAFGQTDDRYKYVYLTDGGHFENLALYEMVLRRCRVIVVSDAAQDEDYRFADLGNAVRKIRIDLGVPIDLPCVPVFKHDVGAAGGGDAAEGSNGKGLYWAIGRIGYSKVDKVRQKDGTFADAPDGILLYIKPAVYGDEPRDVLEYKSSFPAFPHQSTGDQFFDEPQFESYRMLGLFIMESILADPAPPGETTVPEETQQQPPEPTQEPGAVEPAARPGVKGPAVEPSPDPLEEMLKKAAAKWSKYPHCQEEIDKREQFKDWLDNRRWKEALEPPPAPVQK